jgi:hypothetical protein
VGEAEQAGLTPRRGDSLLAQRNLAHELSLEDTDERLGHADSSSFYKALRKWFGRKPGHYRTLILQGAAPRSTGDWLPASRDPSACIEWPVRFQCRNHRHDRDSHPIQCARQDRHGHR